LRNCAEAPRAVLSDLFSRFFDLTYQSSARNDDLIQSLKTCVSSRHRIRPTVELRGREERWNSFAAMALSTPGANIGNQRDWSRRVERIARL